MAPHDRASVFYRNAFTFSSKRMVVEDAIPNTKRKKDELSRESLQFCIEVAAVCEHLCYYLFRQVLHASRCSRIGGGDVHGKLRKRVLQAQRELFGSGVVRLV
jgi:hypothetical protein